MLELWGAFCLGAYLLGPYFREYPQAGEPAGPAAVPTRPAARRTSTGDIKAGLRCLWYLARHKAYVCYYGLRLGVPLWRLVKHDWTKFTPGEFWPYARYYHGDPATRADPAVGAAYAAALALHHSRNDHHPEYWADPATGVVSMPSVAIREMVADWYGAGAAKGQTDVRGWYEANRSRFDFSVYTRAWVEDLLC